MRYQFLVHALLLSLCGAFLVSQKKEVQALNENPELDKKVEKFLPEHSGKWYNLNLPPQDGKLLYDLVLKGHYKSALDISESSHLTARYTTHNIRSLDNYETTINSAGAGVLISYKRSE